MESQSIRLMLPEITLFLTAILALLVEILTSRARPAVVTAVACCGMVLALVLTIVTCDAPATELFSRAIMIDPVSQFFKTLFIVTGIVTVILAWMSREIGNADKAELHALVALGTLGMCVLSSSTHFLLIFLSYELVAIGNTFLVAFKRRSGLSSEAGTKLFVHGTLTSILFAFGIVMLYGAGKSFNVVEIREKLLTMNLGGAYLWLSFGLIFTAVSFRMAAFPFHFLLPDLIEGAASPVSAFYSVTSGAAAMAFALRLCAQLFSSKVDMGWANLPGFSWPDLITGVAAVTMTLGNLTALYQTNLKRLLGYAVTAQLGYILMGLAVSNHTGVTAVLFSLAVYGAMTLGAFFVIQIVTDSERSEDISVLRGLVWRHPAEGVFLCVFLLGLAGLPPFAGFVGRFYVLGVVVKQKLYWLSIIAASNWVIGLTYYLSMVRQVFAAKSHGDNRSPMKVNPVAHVALSILLLPTVAFGIYWDPVMNYIARSLSLVLW